MFKKNFEVRGTLRKYNSKYQLNIHALRFNYYGIVNSGEEW